MEFKGSVQPALASALETLTSVREQLSNAISVLAGETPPPSDTMGPEDDMSSDEMSSDDMSMATPDDMNLPADEFSASDAATGGAEALGRARRESREISRATKLDEAHSIISRLAK